MGASSLVGSLGTLSLIVPSALSFGIPVGDVPSVVDQPRLVAAIARGLYLESVDPAAHERYINTPLVAPDPAPYQRAVETPAREAA